MFSRVMENDDINIENNRFINTQNNKTDFSPFPRYKRMDRFHTFPTQDENNMPVLTS